MILDNRKILEIVSSRPNETKLKKIKEYTDKALMHVKGVKLGEYIEKINQFEPQDLVATRKKYAVSNKDLFSRLLRPIDKVFAAKGGSTYYNLPDKQAEVMKDYCANVSFGYSIRKWLQVFWMPAIAYDPMGLVFIEINADGKVYPTYKAVGDVFDYKPNGRKLEYVIFNKDERIDRIVAEGKDTKGRVYRVVDDVSDRIVEVTDKEVLEIEGETYLNYFLQVPAMIISDIYDPVKGFYVSNIDEVIEKADQFLLQGSVKNIFKNYFGFPQYWTYQSACPECKGTKILMGSDCTFCKGTGLKQRTDPSETIYLPVPQDKDSPLLAPNVGGFISPDIAGWDKMDSELRFLENGMYQTLWGTHQLDDAKNETATGKFIDVQPVNDKLNTFSDAAEVMETFIVNSIGQILFQSGYKGASITYGKRYLIETPDELWKKYEDARRNGAPTSALDDLYNDYLQARYSANALELEKYGKLARVEPYKHLLLSELGKAPAEVANKKLYYADWILTKPDPIVILTPVEKLQAEFAAYCEEREAKAQEKIKAAQEAMTAGGDPNNPNDPKEEEGENEEDGDEEGEDDKKAVAGKSDEKIEA